MRTYKRTMNGIRAMQYQIVVVDGGVHDDASLEVNLLLVCEFQNDIDPIKYSTAKMRKFSI